MHAIRFTRIGRLLATTHTRRGLARFGLASAPMVAGASAASGKKRQRKCRLIRCLPCHRCKRGHCKQMKDGAACGFEGSCVDGICVDPLFP